VLHVLKMQWFSMLPKYVKLISGFFFFLTCVAFVNVDHLKVKGAVGMHFESSG